MQTEVTSFANNSLPTLLDVTVAYVCTPCWMLLRVVGSCFTQFEFGQTFKPSTPDITFVPWSPKRSATMLDPFAKLFQHCWHYARASCIASKVLWAIILTMHCRSNIFGICCVRFLTTANTDPTIPNIVAKPKLSNYKSRIKCDNQLILALFLRVFIESLKP